MALLERARRGMPEAIPAEYHNFLTAYLIFNGQLEVLKRDQAQGLTPEQRDFLGREIGLRLERVVMELQLAQDMLTNDAKVLVSTPQEMAATGESLCFLLYPPAKPQPVDPKKWTFARQYASALTSRPGESKPVKPVMGVVGVHLVKEYGFLGKKFWSPKEDSLSAIMGRKAKAGTAWMIDPAILQKIGRAVIRELPRGVRKPILAAGF
jgi:hypothetical protein